MSQRGERRDNDLALGCEWVEGRSGVHLAVRTCLAVALLGIALSLSAASAQASFMNCKTTGLTKPDPTTSVVLVGGCDWRIGQPPLAAGPFGGPFWSISFSEPVKGLLGTLLIDVQHLKSPDDLAPGQKHTDPNPKNPQQINAGVFGETTR